MPSAVTPRKGTTASAATPYTPGPGRSNATRLAVWVSTGWQRLGHDNKNDWTIKDGRQALGYHVSNQRGFEAPGVGECKLVRAKQARKMSQLQCGLDYWVTLVPGQTVDAAKEALLSLPPPPQLGDTADTPSEHGSDTSNDDHEHHEHHDNARPATVCILGFGLGGHTLARGLLQCGIRDIVIVTPVPGATSTDGKASAFGLRRMTAHVSGAATACTLESLVNSVLGDLAESRTKALQSLKAVGVRFIDATAFKVEKVASDEYKVEFRGERGVGHVTCKHVVSATGSRTSWPEKLARVQFLRGPVADNESLLTVLKTINEAKFKAAPIVVYGPGIIGMEWGSVLARLVQLVLGRAASPKVLVIGRSQQSFLKDVWDQEAKEDLLERVGVDLQYGEVTAVQDAGEGFLLVSGTNGGTGDSYESVASLFLCCTRREGIVVDGQKLLPTTHVIGDAKCEVQLAPHAVFEARQTALAIAAALAGRPPAPLGCARRLCTVVWTYPAIALTASTAAAGAVVVRATVREAVFRVYVSSGTWLVQAASILDSSPDAAMVLLIDEFEAAVGRNIGEVTSVQTANMGRKSEVWDALGAAAMATIGRSIADATLHDS